MVQQSPKQTDAEKEFSLGKVMVRAVGWTLVFVILFFIVSAIVLAGVGYSKLQTFADAASQTPQELYQTWSAAWRQQSANDLGTILLLGSDHLANRGNDPVLTDTMMLARLDSANATIALYSLPRDLWLPTYKTKINALYYYGQQRNPVQPTQLVTEAFQVDLGIKVDHIQVIGLEELGQLVDEIGGLPIHIPVGFVDPQFPRTDVDIKTERDPAKLYQRVEFVAGEQTLSGEQVLQYVRSRHSESDQGTDIARAARQQLVISSLVNLLRQPSFYTHNIQRAGKVYKFYLTHFAQLIPPEQLVGHARLLWPQKDSLNFKTGSPSIYPDNAQGVIIHPPVSAQQQQQWVYVVRNLAGFQQEVSAHLGIKDTSHP